MTPYEQLDINERINLKGALVAWAAYAIDHFRDELDKKVYRIRAVKGGKRKYNRRASGRLRQAWWRNVSEGRVVLEFLQYGRFVDMGVGKGVSANDRQAHKLLRIGSTGRQRRAWYSKRKAYEVKRLNEILATMHSQAAVEALESAFTFSLKLTA